MVESIFSATFTSKSYLYSGPEGVHGIRPPIDIHKFAIIYWAFGFYACRPVLNSIDRSICCNCFFFFAFRVAECVKWGKCEERIILIPSPRGRNPAALTTLLFFVFSTRAKKIKLRKKKRSCVESNPRFQLSSFTSRSGPRAFGGVHEHGLYLPLVGALPVLLQHGIVRLKVFISRAWTRQLQMFVARLKHGFRRPTMRSRLSHGQRSSSAEHPS